VTTSILSQTSRRDFIRNLGAAGAAVALLGQGRAAAAAGKDGWNCRVGVCNSAGNWEQLKQAGCDYVEDGVGRLLNPRASEEEFQKTWADAKAKQATILACNGFLPGELKLVGPEIKHDEAVAYATKAFERAQKVGFRIIVLGSGGARKVPEGFERAKAEDQFVTFLRKLAPIAADHGITVAMESLNRSETNFGNTVAECYRFARAVDHAGFKLTADMYHMLREEEGPEILTRLKGSLVHCHVAEKKDRTPPGTAGDDFKPYLRALRELGYNGGISLECRWKTFAQELAPAVAALRLQIAEVQKEA
jgi:sugar phosphate isomerase/epimerase